MPHLQSPAAASYKGKLSINLLLDSKGIWWVNHTEWRRNRWTGLEKNSTRTAFKRRRREASLSRKWRWHPSRPLSAQYVWQQGSSALWINARCQRCSNILGQDVKSSLWVFPDRDAFGIQWVSVLRWKLEVGFVGNTDLWIMDATYPQIRWKWRLITTIQKTTKNFKVGITINQGIHSRRFNPFQDRWWRDHRHSPEQPYHINDSNSTLATDRDRSIPERINHSNSSSTDCCYQYYWSTVSKISTPLSISQLMFSVVMNYYLQRLQCQIHHLSRRNLDKSPPSQREKELQIIALSVQNWEQYQTRGRTWIKQALFLPTGECVINFILLFLLSHTGMWSW